MLDINLSTTITLSPYSSHSSDTLSTFTIPITTTNSPTYVGESGIRAAGWDLDREMHYHLLFMRLRCLRFVYRFVRGRVVLLLVLDSRSGDAFGSWGMLGQVGTCTARATFMDLLRMLDAAPGCQTSRELGYGIGHSIRRTALLMEEEARLSRAAWA
ncbi:hypothetical protein Tco_0679818 [Tanacetum coccineum]|uniref:Uncharacterized protein n=1 Tax=Tanacetum coccineum TaxID=301880 RepID=A0ABQ4XIV9_9ASTR